MSSSCQTKLSRHLTTKGKYTIYLKPDDYVKGCGTTLCGQLGSSANPIFLSQLQSFLDAFSDNQPIAVIAQEAGTYTSHQAISISPEQNVLISGVGSDATSFQTQFRIHGRLKVTDASIADHAGNDALVTVFENGRFVAYQVSLIGSSHSIISALNGDASSHLTIALREANLAAGIEPCFYGNIAGTANLDLTNVQMEGDILEQWNVNNGNLIRNEMNVGRKSTSVTLPAITMNVANYGVVDWQTSGNATTTLGGGLMSVDLGDHASLNMTDINHQFSDMGRRGKDAYIWTLRDLSQVSMTTTGLQATCYNLTSLKASGQAVFRQTMTNSIVEGAAIETEMQDNAQMIMNTAGSSFLSKTIPVVKISNLSSEIQTIRYSTTELMEKEGDLVRLDGSRIDFTADNCQMKSDGKFIDCNGDGHTISLLNSRSTALGGGTVSGTPLSLNGNIAFNHFGSIMTSHLSKGIQLNGGAKMSCKCSEMNFGNLDKGEALILSDDGSGVADISSTAISHSGKKVVSRLNVFSYSNSSSVNGSNLVEADTVIVNPAGFVAL